MNPSLKVCAVTFIAIVCLVSGFGPIYGFLDAPFKYVELKGDLSVRNKVLIKEQILHQLADATFFKVDLPKLQQQLGDLPQVANISLRRIWPSTLVVDVSEQKPVARWGNKQFLNNRGQIFTAENLDASNLPQLLFPDHQQQEVMQNYQLFSTLLQPLKLQILRFQLTEYGAWQIAVQTYTGHEIELVLGRHFVLEKIKRFSKWYQMQTDEQLMQIGRVDLRYRSALAVASHNRRQW